MNIADRQVSFFAEAATDFITIGVIVLIAVAIIGKIGFMFMGKKDKRPS